MSETVAEQNSTLSTPIAYIKSYGVYVIVLVIFLVACYFAYTNFMKNKGDDDEEDDKNCGDRSVMDYNLKEEINQLRNMQTKILVTLSDDVEQ